MTRYLDLEPIDVLCFRGNRLFAETNAAEALMPPPPTVVAGALRSRILVDRQVDLERFARGQVDDPEVAAIVGAGPKQPGTFAVTFFGLRGAPEAEGPSSLWLPLPADLVASRGVAGIRLQRLEPVPAERVAATTSYPLPWIPVLRRGELAKPLDGLWISARGLADHLAGRPVPPQAVVPGSALWATDPRLGIALDSATRTVEEGMLYTTDTVALRPGVHLVVGVDGAGALLPTDGLLRLGGDGHAVRVHALDDPPSEPWPGRERPRAPRRFRVVLATPGIFPASRQGPDGDWLLPGTRRVGDEWRWHWQGAVARILAAAVPRYRVVSGWDLAHQAPKPALRAVPAGSVYWLEHLEGDLDAALEHVTCQGLWTSDVEKNDTLRQRRAEGFNRVWIGHWNDAHDASQEA